jgi:hypothetical protein
MTRRPAPNDVGRSPFGAPPRHLSTHRLALACSRIRARVSAPKTALESFTEMMLGRRLLVAAGRTGFARVRGCKTWPAGNRSHLRLRFASGRRPRDEAGWVRPIYGCRIYVKNKRRTIRPKRSTVRRSKRRATVDAVHLEARRKRPWAKPTGRRSEQNGPLSFRAPFFPASLGCAERAIIDRLAHVCETRRTFTSCAACSVRPSQKGRSAPLTRPSAPRR